METKIFEFISINKISLKKNIVFDSDENRS
jgi:hypothetical protein